MEGRERDGHYVVIINCTILISQRMLFPSRPQLPRRQTNPVINVTGQIGIYLRVQTNARRFYATNILTSASTLQAK